MRETASTVGGTGRTELESGDFVNGPDRDSFLDDNGEVVQRIGLDSNALKSTKKKDRKDITYDGGRDAIPGAAFPARGHGESFLGNVDENEKSKRMRDNNDRGRAIRIKAKKTLISKQDKRRRNKISKNFVRERQFDKELDVPETVLKHIEAHMVTIVEQTEMLKQTLTSKTSARLPYPPVFVKSVSAEVTRDILAEIIERTKNKMSEPLPHFPHDKKADLKDIEFYMAAIGNPQELKQGHLCETSAEIPHPIVTVKSEKRTLKPHT
ncbi:hypothetical protein LINGRAHAP2_LOCUS23883 [Linum grandiflorum]